jgi:hypothetical protein
MAEVNVSKLFIVMIEGSESLGVTDISRCIITLANATIEYNKDKVVPFHN